MDRTVVIEVTGLCRQNVARTSNYSVKVPFSSMSEVMQNISRMGGKVASVRVFPATTTEGEGGEG
ncbi:MAG: rod-capping linker protein [Cyanobacteria bacterium SID2]|nr:rod-capping linker protein [Cyanobacteria bacterium SID2]MBP0005853.1 rod-capping linker protein [Cyanobacteria bacterium SBC]